MKRNEFLKILSGTTAMLTLGTFKDLTDTLGGADEKMPVLFVGHGSPMNGIEDNEFSRRWRALGDELPRPKAVLVVSAHWLTRGTKVTAMTRPKTIHDFGGFPQELFGVQYPAPGDPGLAAQTRALVGKTQVELDHDWGLDHGAWTIVRHMYPQADIPVLQFSIDYNQPPRYHYELAKELAALRRKGVLILASGNMVHNLRLVDFARINEPEYGFDWAHEMNATFKKLITDGNHDALIDYEKLGQAARLAIPTPDHYYPLLYALGLQEKNDEPTFFNDRAVGGSLTMTSVRWS
jgi:4,5-DOPA dioxygenase extradiol